MPFRFDLVSPERLILSQEVDQVDLPGVEGDLGVLAGHAPLVTALRPGVLTVHAGGRSQRYIATGGFAEIGPAGLTVLADMAAVPEELDAERLAQEIRDLEEDVADAGEGAARDKLQRKLDQLREVRSALAA
jgi:F-type H+-transporting ATPase subunit epsilon